MLMLVLFERVSMGFFHLFRLAHTLLRMNKLTIMINESDAYVICMQRFQCPSYSMWKPVQKTA